MTGSSSDVTEKVHNGKVAPNIEKPPNEITRKDTDGGISYATNMSKLSGTSTMGDTNISYEPESFRTNPSPEKPKNKEDKDKNNNTQTVVIDVRTSKVDDVEAQKEKHRNKNPPSVNRGLPIFGMSKVTFIAVVVIVLMTVGGGLFGWLKIPGLNNQIDRLKKEVENLSNEIDRLTSQIDRLEIQNDRLENSNERYVELNDEFNKTVVEFGEVNEEFNSTVDTLEDANDQLNATNQALMNQVQLLNLENERYEELNKDLNGTKFELSNKVSTLQSTVSNLHLENGALNDTTLLLTELNLNLNNLTDTQNTTLFELKSTLQDFTKENDRLEELNNELTTIVDFLNQTSQDVDNSLDQITSFLSSEIESRTNVYLANLKVLYQNKIEDWRCDYESVFGNRAFGNNYNLPIDNVTQVVKWVDDRVLDELCLDPQNFNQYLAHEHTSNIFARNQTGFNSISLIQATYKYTTAALDYYFPNEGEVGLDNQDWRDAGYDCDYLKDSYVWTA